MIGIYKLTQFPTILCNNFTHSAQNDSRPQDNKQ